MAFRPAWLAVVAALTVAPVASAQDVGKGAATAPANATSAPVAGATVPTATAIATASGPAPTMGYAYGTGGTTATHRASAGAVTGAAPHARARVHRSGPVATLPGFEMLPEGGSRLFVQLTANVQVDEKPVAGGITFVLKGAHIVKRNNENALVTVHFNTPVTRARLLPSGGDLHFVVDLRQNVKPTWKLVPAKDGATVLQIDFPGGAYLPASPPTTTPEAPKK